MNKIKLQDKEYPVRLTIGAMVQYKHETGEDFSQFKGDDMEKLGCIIFHAARSASKADGVPFPFNSPEEILDYIDMSVAAELLDFGGKSGDSEDDGKKK